MLFAMIIEREPLGWADMPRALMTWVQVVGALAALGALLWYIASVASRGTEQRRVSANQAALAGLFISWIGFLLVGGIFALSWMGVEAAAPYMATRTGAFSPGDWLLTLAGASALAVVLAPLLLAIATRFRGGRIWAIARLSLKEAIRSRVVLIFGLMSLVFLFADWFVPYKPEDQVRNYVRVLYWSMTPLFLMTASLLGSFGIPTDVKSQSIHTIVTKPVEKFEIVLGRFLGYAVLITLGLAAVTAVSMLYVFRGVTQEARQESFTARVPIYGGLTFHRTKTARGENVGRQFDIRGYITGLQPNQEKHFRQYGIWSFDSIPAELGADGAPVRCEFGLDIYRLTKGVENQGVLCTFLFADGRLSLDELEDIKEKLPREFDRMQEAARKSAGANPEAMQKASADIQLALLKKYGVYVKAGFNVTDNHTQQIEVPAALFEHLRKLEEANPRPSAAGEARPAMFQTAISVDYDARGANQQLLGLARHDLYVLAAERSFFVNFVKGIIGIWCLTMLVLGIAISCSTYLSGVISWLCTVFLIIAGMFVTDIQELAENRTQGGGPIESAYRLISKTPLVGQLDETPATSVITGFDEIYRWWLRRFLNLVPDITRYDLHPYVANGFDISWTRLLLLDNIIPLLGYLIPCAILAFYLMKYREIANPM